jgi:hypothetical protein
MLFTGKVYHLLKQASQIREISTTFIRSTLRQKDGLETGKKSLNYLNSDNHQIF